MPSTASVEDPPTTSPAVTPALVVRGASKTYGSVRALRDVDLEVPRGTVFGVLGPNGAGKTTLLRAVIGLVHLDEGAIETAGAPAGSAAAMARCGSLIERPAFVPSLSAEQNLEVLARARGVGRDRVAEVLRTVGLADRAADRFRSYSVGMGQRLGIAAALLPHPDVLVLDEPTSGLDPDAVVAVRELIRGLAATGTTVIFSSHVLSEVERVCDRVLVLRSGQVVADAPVHELRSSAGATSLGLTVDPRDRAAEVLTRLGWEVLPQDGPPDSLTARSAHGSVPEAVRALVSADVDVHRVAQQESDLESLFFSLVRNGGRS